MLNKVTLLGNAVIFFILMIIVKFTILESEPLFIIFGTCFIIFLNLAFAIKKEKG